MEWKFPTSHSVAEIKFQVIHFHSRLSKESCISDAITFEATNLIVNCCFVFFMSLHSFFKDLIIQKLLSDF